MPQQAGVPMPFFSVEHYIRKHGLQTLERFQARCNEGASLKALSSEFDMSVPTVCRIRDTFFRRVYVMREGVQNYLKFQISTNISEVEERETVIRSNLRLLKGGK